jgi:hypothetical protein
MKKWLVGILSLGVASIAVGEPVYPSLEAYVAYNGCQSEGKDYICGTIAHLKTCTQRADSINQGNFQLNKAAFLCKCRDEGGGFYTVMCSLEPTSISE